MNNIYDININSSGSWAFGIDETIYDELINETNKEDLPFDSRSIYYIKKYPNKCKVIFPNLIICDIDNSSLRNYKRYIKNEAIKHGWNLNDYDFQFYKNLNILLYI